MSNKNNNKQQPFDDALPERLLKPEGLSLDEQIVRIHQGASGVVSPYIVRLSSQEGGPVGDAFVVEDADIFPDEAPLVEYREGTLHFAEDHTLAQMIEGRREKEEMPILAPYPAIRGYDQAVPRDILEIKNEVQDIFAELLAEENEKDALGEALQEISQQAVLEDVSQQIPIPSLPLIPSPPPSYTISYANGEEVQVEVEPPKPQLIQITIPKKSWKIHAKASLAFATLAAIILLPLQASFVFANALNTKQHVEEKSSAGLSQFLRGADALQEQDFSAASTLFGNASGAFASASESLSNINGAVGATISLIPSTEKTASTAKALVNIGENVSHASKLLAKGMNEVTAAQALGVTDRLALIVAYTQEALPYMQSASHSTEQINMEVIPKDMQEQVAKVITLLPALAQSFEEVVTHADALSALLGANGKRTYMVAFQNNTELRATGGFMGSFAEVSFEKGAITDMRIPGGGTYDVQGQLRAFVAAPGPLQLLRARWEFQDANWFPDFPTSARKMLWFYQSAGGPSVDGVLSINANVLEQVLAVLGPITLKSGLELNAENVLFEMQKEAEIFYDKEANTPKAIVGELTEHIFTKLETADAQTLLKVAGVFVDSFNNKNMQVYFSENSLQSTVKSLGWTGEMRTTSDDYLMVVHTNVGGGKTDSVIDRDVTVDSFIAEDGTIENTVTLTQTHRGMENALFTGMNNVDYVRIYVPEGSTFITGAGFEVPSSDLFQEPEYPLNIDEDLALAMQDVSKDPITETDIWNEQGKTVFGNWVQTAPGETQTVTFTYRLPWSALHTSSSSSWAFAKQVFGAREALSHAIVVQKQSGVTQNVLVRVHQPHTFAQIWSSSGEQKGEFFVEGQRADLFAGWIFER